VAGLAPWTCVAVVAAAVVVEAVASVVALLPGRLWAGEAEDNVTAVDVAAAVAAAPVGTVRRDVASQNNTPAAVAAVHRKARRAT